MDSLMQFAKTGESAIEPDDSFLLAHPSVDISLNLSLIRSIKAKMIAVAQHLDLELASVAHAFAYFEKLCLRGLVNKETRRIKGATCLFLATKVNEHKRKLEGFLDAIDKYLDVSEKEVRAIEFATFAELEFNLFLPKSEFIPHLERILRELGKSDIESYVEKRTFYLHYPEQSVLISS
ncbi:hypothetical protein DSO57_1004905 [Entomophthora muscae]|uniref:Uncharacterized protein n=1 Tax=Entomophthora muscae TaxID=34485 RepID=A0ACC2SKQ7_9FUNG|nr:hypothetical protein DSO57_1004905 [Entomophthora muscae]